MQNFIENQTGYIRVPLGQAGPLCLNGKQFTIPLATTEKCLVASINRGCKAIRLSGEATVTIEKVGITRAPVFKLQQLQSQDFYQNWLDQNLSQMQSLISSQHLSILRAEAKLHEDLLYIKFYFDPDQAMGMNMATIACDEIKPLIESQLQSECITVSSNFCSDKKPSPQSRGYKATAKVKLTDQVITEVLKTTPQKLNLVAKAKLGIGSKLAQSIATNAHHANMLAAIYIATGQDPAHIVDGSTGSTTFASNTFTITIPSILCGTIGGGTQLEDQQSAIQISGAKSSEELAELIAGAVLAGEISLLASLAEGSLAQVHANARQQ
jgi:hydroxymethylglutaryl-CoA reductase (NADPH)